MPFSFKNFKFKFLELIPLILLFITALNGVSILDLKFFSINIHYILIYFWVLRQPAALGYGYIFLAGIINDVIFGLPMGASSLSLLIVASALWVVISPNLVHSAVSLLFTLFGIAGIYVFLYHYYRPLPPSI